MDGKELNVNVEAAGSPEARKRKKKQGDGGSRGEKKGEGDRKRRGTDRSGEGSTKRGAGEKRPSRKKKKWPSERGGLLAGDRAQLDPEKGRAGRAGGGTGLKAL